MNCNVTAACAHFFKSIDIIHSLYCFTKVQKCGVGGERRTQGLLGMSGCGPPGGAPLGEKRSGLLMRE